MAITFDNDTNSTLLVTVYDLNADHQKVLASDGDIIHVRADSPCGRN
jgi:hypothetical protein